MATNGNEGEMIFTQGNKNANITEYTTGQVSRSAFTKSFYNEDSPKEYAGKRMLSNIEDSIKALEKYGDLSKKTNQEILSDLKEQEIRVKKILETRSADAKTVFKIIQEYNTTQIKAQQALVKSLQNDLEKAKKSNAKNIKDLELQVEGAVSKLAHLKDEYSDIDNELEKLNKTINEGSDSFAGALSNTLKTTSNEFRDLANMFNLQAMANNKFEQSAHKKLDIMNSTIKQYGMSSDEFSIFQKNLNSTIKDLNAGLFGNNLYSGADANKYMQNLSALGIYSTDLAEQQMKSSIMATKYLGVSNETQQEMFKYMKRTNDYSMLDQHNKTIVGILKQQLGVSLEQLDQLTTMATSTSDLTYAAGMSPEAIANFQTQSLVVGTALKSKLGAGGAESVMSLLNEAIGASATDMARLVTQYGIDPNAVQRLQTTGDVQGFINSIQGTVSGWGTKGGSVVANRQLQQALGSDASTLSAFMELSGKTSEFNSIVSNALDEIKNGNQSVESYIQESTQSTMLDKVGNWLDTFLNDINWKYTINLANAAFLLYLGSKGLGAFKSGGEIVSSVSDLARIKKMDGLTDSVENVTKAIGTKQGGGLLSTIGNLTVSLGALGALSFVASSKSKIDKLGRSTESFASEVSDVSDQTWLGKFFTATSSAVAGSLGAVQKATGDVLGKKDMRAKGFLSQALSFARGLGDPQGNFARLAGLMLLDEAKWLKYVDVEESHKDIADYYNSLSQKDKDAVRYYADYLDSVYGGDANPKDINWANYHKAGLDRVPRDGYKAILHKNEMVLNERQADTYRNMLGIGGSGEKVSDWPSYASSGKKHTGHDMYFSTIGTPVGSAVPGVVTTSKDIYGNQNGGYASYGRYIVVRGDNGLDYYYAHLSERQVNVGDRVTAGQQIGLSGNTGNSSGPHLHFEVRKNNKDINPEPYITDSIRNIGNTSGAKGSMVSLTPTSYDSIPVPTKRFVPKALSNQGIGGANDSASRITSSVDGGFNRLINYLDNIRSEQETQRAMIEAFSNSIM